jgi:hypothetical protein
MEAWAIFLAVVLPVLFLFVIAALVQEWRREREYETKKKVAIQDAGGNGGQSDAGNDWVQPTESEETVTSLPLSESREAESSPLPPLPLPPLPSESREAESSPLPSESREAESSPLPPLPPLPSESREAELLPTIQEVDDESSVLTNEVKTTQSSSKIPVLLAPQTSESGNTSTRSTWDPTPLEGQAGSKIPVLKSARESSTPDPSSTPQSSAQPQALRSNSANSGINVGSQRGNPTSSLVREKEKDLGFGRSSGNDRLNTVGVNSPAKKN